MGLLGGNHLPWRCIIALVLGSLWIGAAIEPAAAQARGAGRAGQADQVRAQREQLFAQRAKAWELFYAGKYEDAARLAQPLLNAPRQDVQAESAHLLARCYWAAGNQRARTQAQNIWQELEKSSRSTSTGLRLQIARSLHLNADEKNPQAIALLEDIVRRNSGGTVIAEAGIELGRLYVEEKRFDDARKALDFAESFLKKDRLPQLELTETDAAPFVKAAQEAKAKLKYDANAGLAEFEQAEKLRKAEKYREAAAIYQKIITTWPESDYAPRSELAIGHCLIGLKQLPKAVEHWQQFIAASPSGPWRGQAHVALIDLFLEHRLDLDQAARQAALASSHLAAGLADEKAGASWKEAAFGLHLRGGVIAFAQGQPTQAVASFDQARALASGEVAEAIDSLIPVVETGKSILPHGVAGTDRQRMDRPTVALTMAVIQALAKRPEAASRYASIVADRRIASTPHQQAFGAFLLVSLDDLVGKNKELENRYRELLRRYPDAPWNDEVLYRLAVMNDAAAATAIDTDPIGMEVPKAQPAARTDPKSTDAVADCYRQVAQGWPDSPRREHAMWRLGRILLDQGHGAEADAILARQLKDYPQGVYIGDAWVRLIDVALEHRFDPKLAKQLSANAIQWVKNNEADGRDIQTASLEPWRLLERRSQTLPEDWIKYEIYLRAGFMAFMEENFAAAHALFGEGGAADLQPGNPMEAEVSGVSLYLLQKACEKKWVPWDKRALDICQTDAQRLGIKLADSYIYSARSDRAVEIYERFMDGDPAFAPMTPQLQAYATWKMALAYAEGPKQIDKAIQLYSNFYKAPYNQTPWVPDAILRLGVLQSNHHKNYREAMRHYHHVATRYPDHELAEKAMYFYCLSTLRLKDARLARQAVEAFVDRYAGSPNTSWRQDVIDWLNRLESEQSEENDRSTGRRSK